MAELSLVFVSTLNRRNLIVNNIDHKPFIVSGTIGHIFRILRGSIESSTQDLQRLTDYPEEDETAAAEPLTWSNSVLNGANP
jgi:hypothetical protein